MHRKGRIVSPEDWQKMAWTGALTPVSETKQQWSSENTGKTDRDMFGGHGMFSQMWPVGYAMAAFGLLPVTCSPIRISFHPLRSTLVYCLAVTALVAWSGYHMLSERFALLVDDNASLRARFNSVLCIGHASGVVLLPLMWLEASHLYRNESLCASLMQAIPQAGRKRCPWATALAWVVVVFTAVGSPPTAVLFMTVVAKEGGAYTHVPVHNHSLWLLFTICFLGSVQSHCVKNFANGLRQCVIQELSLQNPSPRQLLVYRRAWLQLRDLTQGMVVMPLTAMYVLLFVLLMTTLGSYLCLVFFFEREVFLGMLMLITGSHFFGLLLLVCDSSHRTVTAVSDNFLRPLETYCAAGGIGEAAMEEINIFREVVASNVINVSAAGFWDINRGTMSSVAAAAASYLVILIQFRHTERSPDGTKNGTEESAPTTS